MKKLRRKDLEKIKAASKRLSLLEEKNRNLFLENLTEVIMQKRQEIISANKRDVEFAINACLPSALVERLGIDEAEIKKMVEKVHEIKKLDSELGEILEEKIQENGLVLKKVTVPLGVIFVIYESRPEVTIDVASLCVKSANAVILKGGSEAIRTNKALFACVQLALRASGLAKETVSLIAERGEVSGLLKQREYIDLVVARGGYKLVNYVLKNSTIPVLAHSAGGARIYVDESANLSMAEEIILDAKTSKPAACNSLDTVVIHQNIAAKFVSKITSRLKASGVKIVKNDWNTEFLGLRASIKVVKNVEEAVNFINQHTKKHSEGIIATDKKVIDYFTKSIDSAALFINCSTRFHDGYVFGLGSEMGISTGKLHARGPVGLKELTIYKWIAYGNGQIRG